MNQVALVLPYYGKLPWYFSYYLRSLEGIAMDVLFVSDLEVEAHPDNFKPVRMSFDELNALVCAKVTGAVPLKNTRKLCDYKPMYGHIFEEHLKGYEYWAFGDCDLVYGKAINGFLRDVVPSYDVLSLRKHWLSGSLTIIRNLPRFNSLYAKAATLRDVFNFDECVCFDELGGYWFRELEDGRMTMADCEKQKDYFTATVWREPDLRLFHEDLMEEDDLAHRTLNVCGGRLGLGEREVLAFHYINVKRNPAFRENVKVGYGEIGDYIITKAGMFVSPLGRAFWRIPWFCRALTARVKGYWLYVKANGLYALVRRMVGKFWV